MAVDARLVGEMEGRYISLSRRYDSTTKSEYRLSVAPSEKYFQINLWENDESTTLASGAREDVIAPDDAANRLQLSCVGHEIIAWVNGIEISRVEDEALEEGRIWIGAGVFSRNLPGTVEARFDNLEVTTAEPPALPPPTISDGRVPISRIESHSHQSLSPRVRSRQTSGSHGIKSRLRSRPGLAEVEPRRTFVPHTGQRRFIVNA